MRRSVRRKQRLAERLMLTTFCAGLLFVAAWHTSCGGKGGEGAELRNMVDPPSISEELQADLEAWLSEDGQDPADYVLGLFAGHDVVLLGEQHRILHDVLFVQELLPRLSAVGVTVLATEFARRVDQPLLDSLMAVPEWDEQLAREIIFRQFVVWGYREYVDILKAAWEFNRDMPDGAEPLRVVALNHEMDFSHFKSEEDWNNDDIWKQVTGPQSEADWARVILGEVESGKKVLVHCGIHHAFSGFRQPRVQRGEFAGFVEGRMGNHLRQALGARAVTVYLHAAWGDSAGVGPQRVHPATGRLDAFMLGRAGGPFAVGFNTAGSPLGELPITNAIYSYGYDPLTMALFCDGWIYTQPLGEYETVTYIGDWVTEENLDRARAGSMNPRFRDATLEKMISVNKSFKEEFERFQKHLR